MPDKPTIAIIGGTGDLGSGLARLWARAGYPIVIGSRDTQKAEAAARDLCADGGCVRGDANAAAASAGDIVVLSVPYASHDAILEEIRREVAGKIVVDAAVPLVPPKVSVVQLPAAGSPAVVAQRMLGPAVRVVSAFHNVGATFLLYTVALMHEKGEIEHVNTRALATIAKSKTEMLNRMPRRARLWSIWLDWWRPGVSTEVYSPTRSPPKR